MKKTILIVIGISAIVILFAIWLYLLVYGTPTKVTDVFTNFGFFNSSAVTPVVNTSTPQDTATTTVDVSPAKLRQLTTKPVVGFREFEASSTDASNPQPRFIKYAEAGTGHIYSINITTGEETRLSNTTIPNAQKASFSGNGTEVAVRSGYSNNSQVLLLTLNNTGSADSQTLTPNMTDFSFSPTDELLYSAQTTNGLSGYALNINTKITRTMFNVPFQSATVVWNKNNNTPIYIYPKATSVLNGYLYQIKNGSIMREPVEGKGLTVEGSGDYILSTTLQDTANVSRLYNKNFAQWSNLPIVADPNKCTFSSIDNNVVYCGYEISNHYGPTFPDDWYMGTRSFNDRIWSLNLKNFSATQMISPEKETGRQIDITDMTSSADGKVLYFRNKNDNTLWMYEI